MLTTVARSLIAVVVAAVACTIVVWAGTRPGFEVQPDYSSGYVGVTTLGNSQGCSCHGAANATVGVAISGPSSLYPGQLGEYTITTSHATATGNVGIDVAASGATGLTVKAGEPTALSSNEITHSSSVGTLRAMSNGSAAYSFYYTMPLAATVSSTHTLAGVGFASGAGWNHASNFTVTTVAPPDPTSISTTSTGDTSVNLTWTGSSPEFRVIRKDGSSATFSGPTDGTLVYEGANTAATASGLAASTAYTFAVYGKVSGGAVYSTGNQTISVTTTAAPAATMYFVNAGTGNDLNGGTSDAPFKTIKKAISVALAGDTISVAAGTYNTTNGEIFPISMTSGVQLIGAGAASTIIDATGANTRVIDCIGGNANTLIQGFTITGGLYIPDVYGIAWGGGIYTESGDQTTITQNIITNNEARGYAGISSSVVSGGQAYGGGILVMSSSTKITNNIIEANLAVGGAGYTFVGTCDRGGTGGNAYGGGVNLYGSSSAIVANNTIVNNQARGGAGGSSTQNAGCGTGGTGGDGSAGGGTGDGVWVNNIFSSNEARGGAAGSGGTAGATGNASIGGLETYSTPTNCLFHANTPDDGMTGTNAVLSDPLFVDSANRDFRIPMSSPARGAGTTTNAPTVDFTGATRPTPPSIGAYEAIKADTTTSVSSSQATSTLGDSVTFTATITSGTAGTISGTVTFKDGEATIGTGTVSGGSASFSTSSLAEGSHSITAVYGGDSAYNGSTSSVLTQTVNAAPFGAPPNFSATAVSTSQVALSWNGVSGATSYEIHRSTGAGYAFLNTTTATSYNDSGLTGSTTYLYKVRAVDSSTTSDFTAPDAATTILFTDDPLTTVTIAKAVHIAELRTAVNAMRAAAGQGSYAFSDSIAAGVTIRALHITELRTALGEARSVLGVGTLTFTDSTLTAGVTPLKAAHVTELRNGVK